MPTPEPTIYPRWLKLSEAAKYSSIGEKRLVALAASGKIKGFQDPDTKLRTWIFDRFDIDAYREAQAGAGGLDRKKILEYLNGK